MENSNDNKSVADRVKKQLAGFYEGDAWVTDNFSIRVLPLAPGKALQKVPGHNHSVAQLVGHITAWRNFVVQKLTGNDHYDIEDNSPEDWPRAEDWEAVSEAFKLCHENLIKEIDNFPPERWNSKVPGREYSFIYLVCGIVEHDYYHYGQIGGLLAAIQ